MSASDDIKDFLAEQTGIPAKNWKRLSKAKGTGGETIREFEARSAGALATVVEAADGTLSIPRSNLASLSSQGSPKTAAAGWSFCFLEDANPDHSGEMEDLLVHGTADSAVTGFCIFFSDGSGDCCHATDAIGSLLPEWLGEVEEGSFAVHPEHFCVYDEERLEALASGEIPTVTYADAVRSLVDAGFTYDAENCMLAPLAGRSSPKGAVNGSVQGSAEPAAKATAGTAPRFCIALLEDPSWDDYLEGFDDEAEAAAVDPWLRWMTAVLVEGADIAVLRKALPRGFSADGLGEGDFISCDFAHLIWVDGGDGDGRPSEAERLAVAEALKAAGWILDEGLLKSNEPQTGGAIGDLDLFSFGIPNVWIPGTPPTPWADTEEGQAEIAELSATIGAIPPATEDEIREVLERALANASGSCNGHRQAPAPELDASTRSCLLGYCLGVCEMADPARARALMGPFADACDGPDTQAVARAASLLVDELERLGHSVAKDLILGRAKAVFSAAGIPFMK